LTQSTLLPDDVRQLYERHGAALLLYARSFLADRCRSEDVVHGVFLKLLQGSAAMPEEPVGYLYRAVRNAAFNARRDCSRDVSLDSEAEWFSRTGLSRESVLALQSGLRDLPEEQREIVILRIWGGLTIEESGRIAGVPPNTAASRYRYGLEKLRELLKPWQKPEEGTKHG
jgi:RNA polymerase sigma-70 factor (ECF subfamily)